MVYQGHQVCRSQPHYLFQPNKNVSAAMLWIFWSKIAFHALRQAPVSFIIHGACIPVSVGAICNFAIKSCLRRFMAHSCKHTTLFLPFFLSVQSHTQCPPLLQLYQFPPLSLLCPDLPLSLIFQFDI